MLTEHRTTIKTILLTTTPDGSLGIVLGCTVAGFVLSFARTDVTGGWMVRLVDALGAGALCFGDAVNYDCRVRVDQHARLIALGHVVGDRWFELSTEPSPVLPPISAARPDPAERALSYLNKQRALRGRRDLDPVEADYNDDDIIADALHYGWEG